MHCQFCIGTEYEGHCDQCPEQPASEWALAHEREKEADEVEALAREQPTPGAG
jgi:hypothetical protein